MFITLIWKGLNICNYFIFFLRQSTTRTWATEESVPDETVSAQIKQGWSLLATLHCVLLTDKVTGRGSKTFKRAQVEMLATRWQHHCLEVIF